jgi:hypothetical protein
MRALLSSIVATGAPESAAKTFVRSQMLSVRRLPVTATTSRSIS